jgi:ribosomal protein S18 acetylase RimI-like enzyme
MRPAEVACPVSQTRLTACLVRAARPQDVPALMRMKWLLAHAEHAEHALRASEHDWLRDGFGPQARFSAFIAELGGAAVGMITCSERYYTGWPEPAIYVGDIFVDEPFRRRGVARALLGRVAKHAIARSSPMIELTVRADSAARAFYSRCGFEVVQESVNYVAGGPALARLAGQPCASQN